ncbi:DUF4398 domain-containing protein [Dyella sp. A6]|uniref:DUF4398 domain-containing protein n=1 Tax=Dyella aluminiiresistens TaxID=3069105 RepID=UPI002E79FF6B|nr:DUF4398 domain-containing protein [Dyella sp. A6]
MAHRFTLLPGCRRRDAATAAGLLLAAVVLALGGCASVPPPDAAMNQAQTALQSARQAGAADYDPVDLGNAQDKFQLAQMAMSNRKYTQAADLAAESNADAVLARTKAQLGAARALILQKSQANQRLSAENAEAKSENAQHEAAQQAQLAQQQAAAAAAAAGQPASASSAAAPAATAAPAAPASSALPAQAPIQQTMPAPSASVLGAPISQGNGFQTMPDASQNTPPPAPASSSSTNPGGQP